MTTKYSRLPPSGSKKPPTGSASHISQESVNKPLGNAQFLFEPSPPSSEKTVKTRSPSPSVRRRTQSAKSSSQNKASRSVFGAAIPSAERRPVSAAVPGEKKYFPNGHDDGAPKRPIHVPVPRQFLEFEECDACPHHSSLSEPHQRHTQRKYQIHGEHEVRSQGTEDATFYPQDLVGKNLRRVRTFPNEISVASGCLDSLPQGIAALAPWMTPGLPTEWIGVDPDTCLVFLPSLLAESDALPVVPQPQGTDDTMPHKPPPPQPKPFDPRKLFHYDVEKNLPSHMKDLDAPRPKSRPGTSKYVRIYSLNGQLLHDQSKYGRNRTALMVRQEIEDLEMLLEGVGCKGSSNPVVQYQYEISMLKKAVSDTIIQCHLLRRPKVKEEEPPDLTGLREYIREREQVLAKIKARREACLEELAKLEESLGLEDQASQGAV